MLSDKNSKNRYGSSVKSSWDRLGQYQMRNLSFSNGKQIWKNVEFKIEFMTFKIRDFWKIGLTDLV